MLIVVAHCGFCWFCVIVASTMNHICSLSSMFFFFLVYCGYSVFHWCGQHLCKFMGTKESVCIRKEFNSHGTGLGHQLGHRLTVFFYYYYSYQLNYDTTAEINHSLHNCFLCCSPKLLFLMVFQLLLYQTTHDISPGFKPFTTMFSCGCLQWLIYKTGVRMFRLVFKNSRGVDRRLLRWLSFQLVDRCWRRWKKFIF